MRLAAPLLALSVALLAACQSAEEPPDILLVSVDTLRADHLGCYGDVSAQSATVDSLATHGVVFDAAESVCPLTLPSHVSMLTGLYPFRHGARNNGIQPSEDVSFIAEELQDAGYRSAAVVSAAVLDSRYGLDRGFETYDDDLPPEALERGAVATTTRALAHWEDLGDGPRMMWVHYFDPHHPYEPDPDWKGEPYDGEIARVDRELGRLLAGIRESSPQVVVVLLGDHGESLGEHGEMQHGMLLYEATTHVPMILSDPRDPESHGRRVPTVVSSIDVEATLRDLAGLPPREKSQAHSLRDPLTDRAVVSESLVPFYNHGASPLASLRRGRWKYIQAPRPELYDLRADPHELKNLWGSAPSTRLPEQLAELHPLEWISGHQVEGDPRLDPQSRAMLGSLGYLGSSQGEMLALTDPKDVVAAEGSIREADAARAQGRPEEAERALRQVLEDLPDNWRATWKLGDLLVAEGKLDEAAKLYEATAERTPKNLSAWLRLGRVYRQQGRYPESLAALARIQKLYPDHPEANVEVALTMAAAGARDEAIAKLRALSRRTGNPAFRSAIEELGAGDR